MNKQTHVIHNYGIVLLYLRRQNQGLSSTRFGCNLDSELRITICLWLVRRRCWAGNKIFQQQHHPSNISNISQHIIETPPKRHTIIQTSPTHHQNTTTSSQMKKTSPSVASYPFRRHRRPFVRPSCCPSRRPSRRRPLNGKVFIPHTSHCTYLASFALVIHFG